jgi:hypothetical protein
MMLEHPFDVCSDRNLLHRIAEQVAHHAHAIGMRQLDQYGEVGTMLSEDRVRGMPDPLPTEDAAARFDLDPLGIEGVTAVTQPFRSELPGLTMAAALYEQPVLPQPRPVRS